MAAVYKSSIKLIVLHIPFVFHLYSVCIPLFNECLLNVALGSLVALMDLT